MFRFWLIWKDQNMFCPIVKVKIFSLWKLSAITYRRQSWRTNEAMSAFIFAITKCELWMAIFYHFLHMDICSIEKKCLKYKELRSQGLVWHITWLFLSCIKHDIYTITAYTMFLISYTFNQWFFWKIHHITVSYIFCL